MYGRVITSIVKPFTKVSPEADSVAVKDVKNFLGKVNVTLERSPNADGFVKEVSKRASHSVCTNPISKIKNPLDRESSYSNFFGVTSSENIMQKIYNQLALTTLKSEEQNISEFPTILLDVGYPYTSNTKILEKSMANLFESGTGRLTMMGKTFGNEQATHTIGLVLDKKNNTIYVLDSLPKDFQAQYRNSLVKTLTNDSNIKLVFSSKPQQQINEYTCNNWTHANIEAVKDVIKDGKILSEDKLNSILPEDINKILKSQMEYLTNEHKSEYTTFVKACEI